MKTSKISFWQQFAQLQNAEYIPPAYWHSDKAIIMLDEFKMICDYYDVYNSKGHVMTEHTRISIPFITLDNFEFELNHESLFTKIVKSIGWKDIEIGDPHFDSKLHLKSKNPEKAKQLFSDHKLTNALIQLKDCNLKLGHPQGILDEEFNENEFELTFSMEGKTESIDEVIFLCSIMEQVFNRLRKMTRIMPMK